ncbi:MAG: NAAT family transporter [Deltaproteobacteria bacterium]|nr:NAAT family transporter [Deltaproteobacteria bacterium]
MDPFAYLITTVISLFAVIDPLGAVPIFLMITPDKTPRARAAIALKSALAVFLILSLFALFGHLVLAYFGITPQAFEIAGGLILIKLAYDLLWARLPEIRFTAREEEEGLLRTDVSVIPLAMPLLSGPGAIATVVVLSHTAERLWMNYFLVGAIFVNSLLVLLVLSLATPLSRLLKETGAALLTRIMGLILMAVGVQFVISGIGKMLE